MNDLSKDLGRTRSVGRSLGIRRGALVFVFVAGAIIVTWMTAGQKASDADGPSKQASLAPPYPNDSQSPGYPGAAAEPNSKRGESLWIEAELLQGIQGYCWPSGPNPKTSGNWGLSGPGWAAEWTQGGESNFLSIACGADDDRAVASADVDIPVAATYRVWVRYRDTRNARDRFQVRLRPGTQPAIVLDYGATPVVEEDNEMKLYWDWAFAWEGHDALLPKGKARLDLASTFREPNCRQVDCLVLTTDLAYHPLIKERPGHPTDDTLGTLARGIDTKLEPLARRVGDFAVPGTWRPRTFRGQGFLYLWNMEQVRWAGTSKNRVPYPYFIRDPDVLAAFEKKYAGAKDVPIFSDPRIVPTFHGSGPNILATDSADAQQKQAAADLVRWLEKHPNRPWAMMMNYAPAVPVSAAAKANFLRFRDRFVGSVAGENLGYFETNPAAKTAAIAAATGRRGLAEALSTVNLAANSAKYRTVFGRDWPNAYREVISCLSVEMTAFAPLCFNWGARTVGYESSAITSGLLGMRTAFLRGAARQNGGLTGSYRSCNFGDAATIFSVSQSYTSPKNILDNYYSVYSGAGMTWFKMDLWYQYMAGSAFFYHEQGFDEYWIPGGTGAAGVKEVQLSPKGKLVDRFLRVTAAHPDRGSPFTPVAFLLDYAHGWDPSPFQPFSFGDTERPDLSRYGDHERMLREYFWTAYHPIGRKGMEPTTATNEVYVPGIFGDIFDVVYAYPHPTPDRWAALTPYPVVIAAGDIVLTAAEGKRLAEYVQGGGTLLVADGHLSGPGVEALELPKMGPAAEADGYVWNLDSTQHPTQRYVYRPISGGRPLATAPSRDVVCAAFERGKGRLILLSIPRGLGIDRNAIPILPRLFAHLTRGLMPLEVLGDVEWMVNRTETAWILTLLNPAGQAKPQQGITPTDYRQNRAIVVQSRVPLKTASDWLFPDEPLRIKPSSGGATLELTVPAGGVRIIEFHE